MSPCPSVCPSLHLSGTSLSKPLNLHLPLIGPSQALVSLRSVSGLSQVSLRFLCAYFLSDRWSLKYFVLFEDDWVIGAGACSAGQKCSALCPANEIQI